MPIVLHAFFRTNPRTRIPETAFPHPYFSTTIENPLVDDILALLNKTGLTLPQSFNLLERSRRIVELEQRFAKGMMP
jgi:hypothetical protein